jgi:hypothetical protein
MPNFGVLPNPTVLLALATQTTNGTSSNLSLPPAASYRFFLKVKTVSGTSPTLDVFLATAYDATGAAGTDYNVILHFAQCTTSGLGRTMTLRPFVGYGDTASEGQSALLGTADGATGSTAVAQNGPINPTAIKVRWVLGGTSPSFAFELGAIALLQDASE